MPMVNRSTFLLQTTALSASLTRRFGHRSFGYDRSNNGTSDDTLPAWVKQMVEAEGDMKPPVGPAMMPPVKTVGTPRRSASKRQKTPNVSRKRGVPESLELEDAKEEMRLLQARLQSALQHIEGLNATVKIERDERIKIQLERDQLKEENVKLKAAIERLEQRLEESKFVLSYEDLKPGGALANYVNDFTFFPDFDCNDAFLDLINYTEACEEGNGLCENLVRYSKVTMSERKEYNDAAREARNRIINAGDDGAQEESNKENSNGDDMSVSINGDTAST